MQNEIGQYCKKHGGQHTPIFGKIGLLKLSPFIALAIRRLLLKNYERY